MSSVDGIPSEDTNIPKKEISPIGRLILEKALLYAHIRSTFKAWDDFRREPRDPTKPDGGYIYMDRRTKFHLAMLSLQRYVDRTEEG